MLIFKGCGFCFPAGKPLFSDDRCHWGSCGCIQSASVAHSLAVVRTGGGAAGSGAGGLEGSITTL
jgi:hypothetical protein